MPKQLYFIAAELPEPFKTNIHEWKKRLSERYKSFHALKTFPHITLQMPMRIEEENENDLLHGLKSLDNAHSKGEVELKNVKAFPPKTIFIDVVKNDFIESLKDMVRGRLSQFSFTETLVDKREFNPHVTLLNRDISTENFYEALKDLKDFPYSAQVGFDSFQLFKHNGKRWEVLEEYQLQS